MLETNSVSPALSLGCGVDEGTSDRVPGTVVNDSTVGVGEIPVDGKRLVSSCTEVDSVMNTEVLLSSVAESDSENADVERTTVGMDDVSNTLVLEETEITSLLVT